MTPDGKRVIIESGFKATFPEEKSFRLQDIDVYRRLSGKALKEMDIGWWDEDKNRLVFIELKGGDTEFEKKHFIDNITQKVTDVLLIMSAVWIGTRKGNDIRKQLPEPIHHYHEDRRLMFVVVIDISDESLQLIPPVREAINGRLEGRLHLFGVHRIFIVNLSRAIQMGLPVSSAE